MLRMLAIPLVVYLLYDPKGIAEHEWAAFVFAAALITDFFDGLLARKLQAITPLGKIMDPVADKLMIIAGLLMVHHLQYINVVWVFVLIGREVIVNSLRTLAGNYGVTIPSIMSARIKVFTEGFGIGFLMLGPNCELLGIYYWEVLGHYCINLSVVLASWSAIYYFFYFYKYLKHTNLTA